MAIERDAGAGQLARATDATRLEAVRSAPDGDAAAFVGGDARDRDVRWVRGFRRDVELRAFYAAHHARACADAAARGADGLRRDHDRSVPSREVLHLPASDAPMGARSPDAEQSRP